MDDKLSSDLDAWLNNVADKYVVVKTLHETPEETTQIVYRIDESGKPSLGPFVRKRFVGVGNRGNAYEQLLQAQVSGKRLPHQPIVYECEREGDTLTVVMEHVEGETLRDMAQRKAAGLELAKRVMPELCDALSELHESFDSPVIHRDVKPSNVIVSEQRLTLIDLGIARMFHDGAPHDTVRYGTPGYAPPEQFGYGQTSIRSDVYALGMTLAFCLTGQDPTSELRESGFVDPHIPVKLQSVLVRATQFDPARRHATAREFKEDFESAVFGKPVSAGGASETNDKPQRFTLLGRIWNTLVIAVWGVMLVAFSIGVVSPSGSVAELSLFTRIITYLGIFVTDFTAIAYMLLDKRRLRKYEPFASLNWKRELLICLVAASVGFILTGVAIIVIK